MDLKERKIRVNVISPGPIDTPIWQSTNLPEEVVEKLKCDIVAIVPANEMGRPEDIAKSALFVASEDGRFTGALSYSWMAASQACDLLALDATSLREMIVAMPAEPS